MAYPMPQLPAVSNSQVSVFCSSWSPVFGLFRPSEGSNKSLSMFVVSAPAACSGAGVQQARGRISTLLCRNHLEPFPGGFGKRE